MRLVWKPVAEETWRRLAALDARCHLSMWRGEQWLVQGARGLVWSGVGGTPPTLALPTC